VAEGAAIHIIAPPAVVQSPGQSLQFRLTSFQRHGRGEEANRGTKSLDPFAPAEAGSIISPGGRDNVFRMQRSRCNCRHRSCSIHSSSPDKRAVGGVELASLVLFDLIPMGPY